MTRPSDAASLAAALLTELAFMRSCIASGERLDADDIARQDALKAQYAALAAPVASVDEAVNEEWSALTEDLRDWYQVMGSRKLHEVIGDHRPAIEAAIRDEAYIRGRADEATTHADLEAAIRATPTPEPDIPLTDDPRYPWSHPATPTPPDGDRPPLPPEVVAHDSAYMAGLIRGRELEREARATPTPLDALEAFFAVERPYIPGANAEDLKAYELAVQRLRIVYDIEQGRREPCPVPSSVTGRSCLLYDGHPQDSPTRFHRYRYEDVFIPAARYLANSPPRTITCPDCGDVLATDEWAGHRLSEGTEVNPSVSEWIEHGLAAAEDLSAAYHEGRDGPGGLNVGTMRAHIDAITAAFEAIRDAPEAGAAERRPSDVEPYCAECGHLNVIHREGSCYTNVGGPSPEPCGCQNYRAVRLATPATILGESSDG